jgi:RHS repeat-associated protein
MGRSGGSTRLIASDLLRSTVGPPYLEQGPIQGRQRQSPIWSGCSFLLLVSFCLSLPGKAQTPFTRTYSLGGGINVSCCTGGMSWGFTPVIQDTSLTGEVQITSITVSDSANILAVDYNSVAGTTWEIFAGTASCGFPPGEDTGVISTGTYQCPNAQTELIFNTNAVWSPPATGTFAGSFNFQTGVLSTNDLGQFILGATSPMTLTQGLYVQILLWGGDVGANLNLSNISITITGTTSGTTVAQPHLLGVAGTTTNPTGTYAEPVNTATGNFFLTATDMAVKGRGLPFVFNRYFNSLDPYNGPLGPGWTHTYNVVLTQNRSTSIVTIKQPDGASVEYQANTTGQYSPVTTGLHDQLQANADGTFTLTKTTQVQLHFNAAGQLLTVADRNGNTQRLIYDGAGGLTEITDTVGREFKLTYNSSHQLIGLEDPTGRTVSYAYDSNGNLLSATNPAGFVTKYAYDSAGRMVTATDARGTTFLRNAYDTLGRVSTQQDGRGGTTQFAYNVPSAGTTTITDPNGNQIFHVYDPALRLVRVVDGAGDPTLFTYDANNNLTSVTDANGHVRTFAFNAAGDLLSEQNTLGNLLSFQYDTLHDLTSATDAIGDRTLYDYDERGNLTSIVNPLGNTASLAYDSGGQLITWTNANGATARLSWDGLGDLISYSNGAGRTTSFSYDTLGRTTAITNGLGHSNTIQYDILGRIVSRTDALGHKRSYSYDAIGELVSFKDAKENQTTYQYDANGNMLQMTDALGHTTSYAYDPNNNRTALINARGKKTIYAFDAANRRVSITDPLDKTLQYRFDPAGLGTAKLEANGNSTSFSYDAANRLIQVAYSDGTSMVNALDANGRRTSRTDSTGTTLYEYDATNHLTGVTLPGGKNISYSYDAAENRIGIKYPDGSLTAYSYDGANKLTRVAAPGLTANYRYDAAGDLTMLDRSGKGATQYTYDDTGRIVNVCNTVHGRTLSSFQYTYDAVGNRVQIVKDGFLFSRYAYDSLNRLISWQSNNWEHASYTYDPDGNRLSATISFRTKDYTYDDADELVRAGSDSYTYDASGNLLSKLQRAMETTFQWNAAGLLASVQSPRGNVKYAYDGDGNRVGETSERGNREYVNDLVRRIPQAIVVYRDQKPTDLVFGNALLASSEGGEERDFFPDALGSVVDSVGTNERESKQFSYDPWGEQEGGFFEEGREHETGGIRFAGYAFDSEDSLYYLHTRYYDPGAGRFLSRDSVGSVTGSPFDQNRYIYARDNPLRYIDPFGTSAEDTSGVHDFGSLATTALSGLSGLLPSLPSKQTAAVLAGAVAVGVVVYVAPEVATYCLLQPYACNQAGIVATEIGAAVLSYFAPGFTSLEPPTTLPGAVATIIAGLPTLEANISTLWNDANAWANGPPDSPVYPDNLNPSGVSESNPNVPDDVDDSGDGDGGGDD